MSSKTLVAFAAVIIACVGAATLSSPPASAYDGDYERYCYYHRYDPACSRYWHPYGGATAIMMSTITITIVMIMIMIMTMTMITMSMTTIMITITIMTMITTMITDGWAF